MIEDMANLLHRFRDLQSQTRLRSLQALKDGFTRISKGLVEVRKQFEEINLRIAPGFNIFNILDAETLEVRTHSAFIAHLFRPDAEHGQRLLFLQSFIELCHSKDSSFPVPISPIPATGWDVRQERWTPQGIIDISVTNDDIGYLFVIENKIEAREQPEQLKRYFDWMSTQKVRYHQRALIYLTPRGIESKTISGKKYFRLSYRQDIRSWLEDILEAVKAEIVRYVLLQYVKTIKNL